jgi:hypothetical protein
MSHIGVKQDGNVPIYYALFNGSEETTVMAFANEMYQDLQKKRTVIQADKSINKVKMLKDAGKCYENNSKFYTTNIGEVVFKGSVVENPIYVDKRTNDKNMKKISNKLDVEMGMPETSMDMSREGENLYNILSILRNRRVGSKKEMEA